MQNIELKIELSYGSQNTKQTITLPYQELYCLELFLEVDPTNPILLKPQLLDGHWKTSLTTPDGLITLKGKTNFISGTNREANKIIKCFI